VLVCETRFARAVRPRNNDESGRWFTCSTTIRSFSPRELAGSPQSAAICGSRSCFNQVAFRRLHFRRRNTQYTGLIIDAKCICLLVMSLGGIVARNIRRLRLERGLSQEALAVDAGIDRTYVSRLERGLENPTVSVLEKLARALSSNIEELFRAPRAAEAPSR